MKTFGEKVKAGREKYGCSKLEWALRPEDKRGVKTWLKRDFPE